MPFAQTNDLRVHYLETGSGAPVLLLHGNWATCEWWEPTLDRLPAGYQGIAPDLRGRGLTRGPDAGYDVPSLAADVLALADALGLERFHVVGHSLGAGVAMQLGLDAPQRLLTLTCVAPAYVDGMPQGFYNQERQQLLQASYDLFAQALRAIAPTGPHGARWQRLVDEGHQQTPLATSLTHDALRDWRPGEALRAIPCPKLVIGGAKDIVVPEPLARRAAEALGARFALMEDVGHSPNIEAPDAFCRLLFAHLAGAAASGPQG